MKREEKSEVVSSFSERLKKAKGIIVAEYSGLKVSELTEIRRELRKNDSEFKIVKNRLARIAMKDTEWSVLDSFLKGPLGIALSDLDPVTLSKVLTKYSETYPALKLKAGVVSGKVIDVKGLQALSKLPSKEELYAKLLGTLQAPASNLVRVLNALPQKLAIALKAISEKKQ